ncbi:MAG: adenylate kinase [Candidatus Cloacimonetes bacterium]|nr:adenylate kinase [Candidatus Cloacimonadota bacterium]
MIDEKKRIVVLLGPPGAGKGTQAAYIKEKYAIPHISTGEILRENIKNGTTLGIEADKYMHKGELVPDDLVFEMLKDRVSQPDCAEGALFDGFPRNQDQADMFFDLRYISKQSVVCAILIDIPDAEVIKRLSNRRACPKCKSIYNLIHKVPEKKIGDTYLCDKCGAELIIRDDDKVETIQNRLKVFHNTAVPLITYFEKKNVLHKVNGVTSPDEIFKQIEGILDNV